MAIREDAVLHWHIAVDWVKVYHSPILKRYKVKYWGAYDFKENSIKNKKDKKNPLWISFAHDKLAISRGNKLFQPLIC